jgi:hypothetical protein
VSGEQLEFDHNVFTSNFAPNGGGIAYEFIDYGIPTTYFNNCLIRFELSFLSTVEIEWITY